MVVYWNISKIFEKGVIPITIAISAVVLFGGKLVWELASNIQIIVYIVAGFILLKILKALGFKK